MDEFKIQELQPTNSIRFFNGGNPAESSNEVLRISRDGIWANPDIPVDEAARLVLKALDVSIKQMVARAVEAEREAFAAHAVDIARRAVKAEIEACEKVCEKHAEVYASLPKNPTTDSAWAACVDLRDAIRARGKS